MRRPNPLLPPAGVTLTTTYDDDLTAGAQALLAVLRHSPAQSPKPTPQPNDSDAAATNRLGESSTAAA